MKTRININPLFLFLCGSLALTSVILLTTGPFPFTHTHFTRTTQTAEKSILFPREGTISKKQTITLIDSRKTLWYSLDGGDSYTEASSALDLHELRNASIIEKTTSIRWHHPEGDFPILWSIPVIVKDHEKKTVSDPLILTYLDSTLADGKVISLSIKNSDLFDEQKGIMVYGESSWIDSGFYKEWWYRSANFSERGSAWERPANMKYFEDGKLRFEHDCGLRISGNATRYFPQKSLRLYATDSEGEATFDYPFWGKEGIKKSGSLLLRNGGNDNTRTMFADLLMHRISRNSNVLTLEGEPVSVYINGNYWGVYEIRERIDEHTIAEKTDVKSKDVTILDAPNGTLKAGEEKDRDEFLALVAEIKKSTLDPEKVFKRASEKINMQSFIDYIILETFFANPDWPENNCTWYKTEKHKWSWILYDLDLGLSYKEENLKANVFDRLASGHTVTADLFNALRRSQSFMNDLRQNVKKMLETQLSERNIRHVFDELLKEYEPHMLLEIKRWHSITSISAWKKDANANLDFLILRRELYQQQIDALK